MFGSLIKCSFNLKTATLIDDCLGDWLKKFKIEERKLVLVGTFATLWAIWKCPNDIIFRDKLVTDPMTLVKLT